MAKLLKNNSLLKNKDFWIVILVVVIGLSTGFFRNLLIPPATANTARVEIDIGDKKRAFEGEIIEDMFILDAILASSRVGKLEFKYAIINNQLDILKIDGQAEDGLSGENWNFYLNDKKVRISEIHRIKIKSGDEILIRFE